MGIFLICVWFLTGYHLVDTNIPIQNSLNIINPPRIITVCGRFSLISSEELIRRIFRINRAPVQMRFNIAPSQEAPVIHIKYGDDLRELTNMRWGLVPSWAKDKSIGNRLINAQCEGLFEKPSFRKAAIVRRCLVPADGFFEWKKEGKSKQPYYIHMKDKMPFAFAGLWETWTDESEETPLLSFTVITTEPNDLVKPIHNRMPVILAPDCYDQWLDPDNQSPEFITPLLRPYNAEEMALYPVGAVVNNPRNDCPECIEPCPTPIDEDRLF